MLCDQHFTAKYTPTGECNTQFLHTTVQPHNNVEVCKGVWCTVVVHHDAARSHDAGNLLQNTLPLQVKRILQCNCATTYICPVESPGKISRQVSRSFLTSNTHLSLHFKPVAVLVHILFALSKQINCNPVF